MKSGTQLAYRAGAIIVFILLGVGLVSSQTSNFGEDPINDRCVLCHVDSYESSVRSHYQHLPFFERQCVACHLREGAGAILHRSTTADDVQVTGALVSQGPLWAKQLVYRVSADKRVEHMIDLKNLDPAKQYRFRIVLSETEGKTDMAKMASSWFGLAPQEVAAAGRQESITCLAGSSSFPQEMVEAPSISCPIGSRIFISWQTKSPLFAWLELQELQAIGLEQLTGVSDLGTERETSGELTKEEFHDLLRDPEDLAIDACYSCHPAAELGTSHPVRIYGGGQNTKIPAELPTLDGMMTCVTCHDPHGSDGKQLVREIIKTKLCVTCHIKFKGKSLSTIFD